MIGFQGRVAGHLATETREKHGEQAQFICRYRNARGRSRHFFQEAPRHHAYAHLFQRKAAIG